MVGLRRLHGQADDLIGLLYLSQRYLGDGRQVLHAGVVKGVGRVVREGRSDLWRGNEQGIAVNSNILLIMLKKYMILGKEDLCVLSI